jgi:multiple sugar transport system permease protein
LLALQINRRKLMPLLGNGIVHLILISFGIIMIAPFIWMVTTSLKTLPEVYMFPPKLLPEKWQWSNYIEAWNYAPFGSFYFNSVFAGVMVTLGQLVTSSLAAYAFSRLRFPGRNWIFYCYLGTMMIPYQVTLIPSYMLMRWFGWIDTYQALIVPFLADTFGVFLLRQYFLTIPDSLEDAALIDGCSRFRILSSIFLPLSKPALATVALMTFLKNWNSFFWPLIAINSMKMRTLPVGLVLFVDEAGTQWHLQMAASVISIVPVILLFVAAQKYFIRGITLTGVKG